MRAVILAGGLGTRLRPYTTVLPKPLMPVGDRPIIEHILGQLARSGVEHVDLCVSHLGELIQAYLQESRARPPGLSIRFHWEDEPLGTAGALRLVPDLEGTFLVMNGDVLTSLDFGDLVDFHRREGAALTIAAHRRRVDVPLGVLDMDGKEVVGYREKPSLEYDASMGVYVYESEILDLLPPGACQFPDFVLDLLAAGKRVVACRTDAAWHDIGTVDAHEMAMQDFVARPGSFGAGD